MNPIVEKFPDTVFVESHGQPVVYIDRSVWHDLAVHLRDEQQFSQCVDVTAVDHLVDGARAVPDGVKAARFDVVANFLSHARNRRIQIGPAGSGHHGCPDPCDNKTRKRQPQPATKAWGGTEKAELGMSELGRGHGDPSDKAWPRSPTLSEVQRGLVDIVATRRAQNV